MIAYKSAEGPEEMLSPLKKIWSVVEEYVKVDKLSSVGLSDINTNTFIELFQWADVRTSCTKRFSFQSIFIHVTIRLLLTDKTKHCTD